MAITSAKICTLCPKGGKPRNGNALLFEGQDAGILVTCNELAKEIITNSDGEFCDDPLHFHQRENFLCHVIHSLQYFYG